MTEPDAETSPSLIQQRMALQRRQTWAIVLIVIWSVSAVWWLTSGLLAESDDLDMMRVIVGVVNVALAVAQIFVLRGVRRDVRAFEQQHGSDAGRQ